MAHFSITIPDNKKSFFRELMNNLNFAQVEEEQEIELSDEQKAILDQRLKNYKNNPDSYLDWEEVQKDIENRLWATK